MRIKSVALLACLALPIGEPAGRAQRIATPPGDPERGGRSPLPLGPLPRPVPLAAGSDQEFLRLDRDGDGVLNFDEMPDALRAERDKWDANQDGHIDLAEWSAYR